MNCYLQKNDECTRMNLRMMGIPFNPLDEKPYKPWLAVNYDMAISVDEDFGSQFNDGIDCGKNKLLFLAVVALRNDTDEHQWFQSDTHPERHIICRYKSFSEYQLNESYHKMTLEELQEYFGK